MAYQAPYQTGLYPQMNCAEPLKSYPAVNYPNQDQQGVPEYSQEQLRGFYEQYTNQYNGQEQQLNSKVQYDQQQLLDLYGQDQLYGQQQQKQYYDPTNKYAQYNLPSNEPQFMPGSYAASYTPTQYSPEVHSFVPKDEAVSQVSQVLFGCNGAFSAIPLNPSQKVFRRRRHSDAAAAWSNAFTTQTDCCSC